MTILIAVFVLSIELDISLQPIPDSIPMSALISGVVAHCKGWMGDGVFIGLEERKLMGERWRW
jgi:hypothetical protein